MPRTARKKSSTGIYHIMLRGIDRQKIFRDRKDYSHFMIILRECKEKSDFKLYAYCLMPNHVHFLIKSENEPLDIIMKRIASRYASWFNFKYQRIGHLFQDRYKSECVENEEYFLTVLRYIMQNPIKAKLERQMGVYAWTSYREYYLREGNVADFEPVIKMYGEHSALIRFLNTANEDQIMDADEESTYRMNENKSKEIFYSVTGLKETSDFLELDKGIQNNYIFKMHENGVPIMHISRMTGISKSSVHRIIKY